MKIMFIFLWYIPLIICLFVCRAVCIAAFYAEVVESGVNQNHRRPLVVTLNLVCNIDRGLLHANLLTNQFCTFSWQWENGKKQIFQGPD
jgi:hypothetical protein